MVAFLPQVPQPSVAVEGMPLAAWPPLAAAMGARTVMRLVSISCPMRSMYSRLKVWIPMEWPRPQRLVMPTIFSRASLKVEYL